MISGRNWIYHSEYSESAHQNDVALIKLERDIPADYQVSEIYDGTGTVTSNDLTLVGYGITNESKEDAGYLRTTVKSINDLDNDKTLARIPQRYNGICSGDSGGPAFIEINGQLKVLGVNSFVTGSSDATVCHGYGSVSYTHLTLPTKA